MIDAQYDDWNHKKLKAILDHYGHSFFYMKKVLDLGCGRGDIAAAIQRLGAEVTCVDARQDYLDDIKKKHPSINVIKADLDTDWPFQDRFDVVLSLGVICHIKNYQIHLQRLCSIADNIIIETEVIDSDNRELMIPIFEEKSIRDLSFNGEGSIVSDSGLESRLSDMGAKFKRHDSQELNSGQFVYNWQKMNTGTRQYGTRRMWFIKQDKFLFMQFRNNTNLKIAEADIVKNNQPALYRPIPPRTTGKPQPQYMPPKRGAQPRHYPQRTTRQIHTPSRAFQSIQSLASVVDQSSEIKIRLYYNYYQDSNPERRKEIDFCLEQNRNSKLFETILIESNELPTYNLFFNKINELSGPYDINIICNADIFFDDTINFTTGMGLSDVYALSRWDWHDGSSQLRDLQNSQDTWIIRGKVQNVDGNFTLGKSYCDNRIAYEFRRAGYNVSNPSKSIKTYHVHNSNIRNYVPGEPRDNIPGPYLLLPTSQLPPIPIFALTSMSPRPEAAAVQRESINSWIAAGCTVVSFQSAAELKSFNMKEWSDVQFVETEPSKIFPSFIPISNMSKWASSQGGYAMIINADCRLSATPAMMKSFALTSNSGLLYLIRNDVDGSGREVKQAHGMDAFIFPTRYAPLIPTSDILCMGKPWWDWVVPISLLHAGKQILTPTFPVLYHTMHPMRWSHTDHGICSAEAVRILNWSRTPAEMRDKINQFTRPIEKEALSIK